jgi:hypothetical protein
VKRALLILVFAATNAQAQTMPGKVEIGGGLRWAGPMSLGSSDATETQPGGSRFTLFKTESRLDSATAVEARFGVRLSDTLQVEGVGSYGKPMLTARIASDAEGIPSVSISESITQFTIEGALVLELPRRRIGFRTVPFVSAGGGYNRQLHETATLIEHGFVYHLGVGGNVMLKERPDAGVKTVGLRVDARALIRTGGVAFDDRPHVGPSIAGTLFVRL